MAVVLVVAGRGQWFFYDEWDFLRADAEWSLLAPHNGHLSLFPQLLTTLVKLGAGLHSYWPYLALTIIAHLAVMHMVWRVMMRTGAAPAIALVSALAFGVLSPGTENTLWAFQVGFITPVATGIGALLLANRPELRIRETVGVCVLLIVGVGFASTGLPFVVAVVGLIIVRHGWRAAIAPVGSFVVVYGSWYLVFARGTTGSDGFGAKSLGDVLIRMPEFILQGLIDSLAKTLPSAALAAPLVVAIVIGAVLDLRRTPVREVGPVYWLVVAAGVFAVLTAYTRVGLGVENASAGRYVYIYGALLTPLVARLLSGLVRRSILATIVVCVMVLAYAGFNAAGTVSAGRAQAELEQTVKRTISAALSIDDGGDDLSNRTPAALVAPTLTMADIRDFVARGYFEPVPFGPEDLLAAEVNLLLTPESIPGDEPPADACVPAQEGWIPVRLDEDAVWVAQSGMVRVIANDGPLQGFGTQIPFSGAGLHRLDGIDDDVALRLNVEDAGGVCVVADR
ncbi:hypothetical protein [Microbacterium ureisolvens]|uniref:hypothetical protein n=1 Tax=Microbacterium ureisolvens TaxID=2781186 RepID=UPI00188869C4|nr:hypothetical protein [Microbacterium ureisolvens]